MNLIARKTRNITIGLFILCTLGITPSIFAGTGSDNPTEIKFIGNVKSQPLFQLNLNNNEAGEYLVTIEDNSGNRIYSEKVKGTNISRKYLLASSEENFDSEDIQLVFIVTSKATGKKQTYKISSKTEFVQQYTVAKL